METVRAFFVGLIGLLLPGFGDAVAPAYLGYVEADYLYVAAESPGRLQTVETEAGAIVEPGAPLFALESASEALRVRAAEARLAAADAQLDDLRSGSRDQEVAVLRAGLARARAQLDLAEQTAERSTALFAQGILPASRKDQDVAALAIARATTAELAAQLAVAELPARAARQQQAEAERAAAQVEVESARQLLAERRVAAPAAGRVEQLFFAPGELVAAGTPVLSLLPDGALKVRFYVPEPERQALVLGESVVIRCSGCPQELVAEISHFAAEPQFTPPVIYSREERHRLTFLVEATLPAGTLHPGQPVSVEPRR